MLTESQKKANQKWLAENYEQITLKVQKGQKAKIREWAEESHLSMTQYVMLACRQKAERDGFISSRRARICNSLQIAMYVIEEWSEEKRWAVWQELTEPPQYHHYSFSVYNLAFIILEQGMQKRYGIRGEKTPYKVEKGCNPYENAYTFQDATYYCGEAKFMTDLRKGKRTPVYLAQAIREGDTVERYGRHYFCPLYDIQWKILPSAPCRVLFGTEVANPDVACDWSAPLRIQRCYDINDAAETGGMIEITGFMEPTD